MQSFTDSRGRAWTLAINVYTRKLVQSRTKLDLALPETMVQLMRDADAVVQTVLVLTEEQRRAAGVTDRDFEEALEGPAVDAMIAALLEEQAGFFQQPYRETAQKALGAIRAMLVEAQNALAPAETSTDSSTNSQASAASTPPV
jgi:hypothetical protein